MGLPSFVKGKMLQMILSGERVCSAQFSLVYLRRYAYCIVYTVYCRERIITPNYLSFLLIGESVFVCSEFENILFMGSISSSKFER